MNLYNLKRILLGFVYPNRCPFCGEIIRANEFYCQGGKFAPSCSELDYYRNIRNSDTYCCAYNDKSKPLIAKAKENADGYAISAVARLLYAALLKNNILHNIDVIIPIPPRKKSMKKRGYSFPALLAKEIAELAELKYSGKTLKLLRETGEQKELSAAERRENLKGAFGIWRKKPYGKNVLVIDDVSTTGATLDEAKRVLSEYAENVYAAAFAKTVYDE